jgi:demethylmenaquinone methyltransferase/2-methoxy-6-polyprenyl-1,4-benzoquinol methylase
MFDRVAPRYDLVNTVMTFGLDRGWRRRTVRLLGLAPGSVVLDLACGTGDLARELGPLRIRAVAADNSAGMLAAARAPDASLVEADGAALPFADGSFDGVVSGFAVRNFADLRTVLQECARIIRPAGRLALLEVDSPTQPLLRLGHAIWFRHVVPRIGALLSDADAYRYLPNSLAYLPNDRALARLIENAGFSGVTRRPLSGGVAQIVTATRLGTYGVSQAAER